LAQDRQWNAGHASLKDVYGDQIELTDDSGETITCRIMAELESGGRRYAVIQTEAMREEDDIEVFRIVLNEEGVPVLETVTDDEEWEQIAEMYDDMQFGNDQQP
jgi:uncharacterized protein YrzB (UPF0473 family)